MRIFNKEVPELGMSAKGYAQTLDNEWDRYLKWRDAQVCVNCQTPFASDKPNGWFTETQCWDCFRQHGPGGKRRADMLAETGNIYI